MFTVTKFLNTGRFVGRSFSTKSYSPWGSSETKPIGYDYKGDKVNGVPSGRGILQMSVFGGQVNYTGHFAGGFPHGTGAFRYVDMTGKKVYNGEVEFKNGVPDGYGKMQDPTGMDYIGCFNLDPKYLKGYVMGANYKPFFVQSI